MYRHGILGGHDRSSVTSYQCFFKPPPSLGLGLGLGFEFRRKGRRLRRHLNLVISAQLSNSFSLSFGLDSQNLNSFQSNDPSQLSWMGPVPGDIAEVEAFCRIFRNSERLHSALMDALCNPLTGECSVSYEVPSDEKPQLEDKIVSVLGCMISLVNKGREDILSGRSSIMNSFRAAEVSTTEDKLPPLALFRSEMKRCSESLHVALENYLIADDDRSLNVWRKLQRLKNVCYDSGFPRGEGCPCHTLFANWSPVYLSASKDESESKDTEPAFWTGGQVTEEGLKWLLDKGYKTIIDLRAETVKDNFCQAALQDAISSGRIELVKIPVEVRTAPTMEQVVKFASYVSDCSKRPIYLHSKEGVLRTSSMVSRWRQYMTRSSSQIVSNPPVTPYDMLSRNTNGSAKPQDSSVTAERSSLEKDINSLQESLNTTHSSVGTFDRSTSQKKHNGKPLGTTALSEVSTDNGELSEATAANEEGSFPSDFRKINPLEAQVPPCDIFSKREMSKFLGSRKISPPSYGGVNVSSSDNPKPKSLGPESSNGSAHVDHPSREFQITVSSNRKVVNGSTCSSVRTTVNEFSEREMPYMTNANASIIVKDDFDNVTTTSQRIEDHMVKDRLALNDDDLGSIEGDMCASSTGVVRVQSRKKAEMFLVRTDGFSCTREKVTESSLAFTHPSTQQQMLMWKSMPKNVLLLKKLGEELMEEAKLVASFLYHQEKMNVLVEPDVHDIFARIPGFGFVQTFYSQDTSDLHEKVDFVACLGGDGVILHASNLFRDAVPPIVSFNLGSLGFLTSHDGEKQGIFQQKIWEGWCGQSQGSANDMWNKMSQEIIKVAKETLGESRGFGPRGKESWWWNENVQSKVRVKKECFKEWSRCRNSETWDKYKIARNETKKAVSEARAQAFDGLYQALGTRDGERSIYRLAKGRERKTRDLDQVKCVKDEKGKVLVHEKDIKERWKAYFHNLFNDGYGYDSSSLDTREEDRNYKYYRRIQKQEVKEALKRMSNGKAVGPDNIPIEVWKTLGDRGLEWLTELFNEIMRSKRMPEEWRRSTLVPIYKNKGDIQNCANYRGIKLMSHTMKLWERVIERRLRKETQVTENQFGFMPGRSTMEAIYLLRRVMEQYRMAQQDLHLIFIDLEKAYDRVPREILWKALEKKGVRVAYIRAIQDMYDRVSTSVRTQGGESDDFPITIGLHQGSTLSPYLFTLILDVLTEQIQEIAPRCMLFADDIVLLGESREELNERLETWRRALETHGFRLSRSKSEYMECKFNKRRRVSNSEVKIGDHIIPQVTRFKYLGSVIQDDGEIEGDVNHRIQAGWMKWRKASGVLCDAKVPIKLKGKFYRTAVRPTILYGTECWAVKSQHENKVGVAEMRMLRWMCGKTRQDKIRNEAIRERVGVAPIVEKMVENRLRWFGHVERRPVDSVVRRVDQMERRQTIRGRGRPKKTIREVIKKDLEINGLDRSMFEDYKQDLRQVIHGNNTRDGVYITLRMRLRCEIFRKGKAMPGKVFDILNEVVVDRGSNPYLSKIECYEHDRLITKVQGDGVIVATPTGSTAYSTAAGGSMVHPNVPCILFTPICPHSLSFRPVILPDSAQLELKIPEDARSNAWVSFDGKRRQQLSRGDSVRISMSQHPLPTVNKFDQTGDWFSSLIRCLNWNERLDQKAL
ncbi:NAD kinase 2, chloroplastic [Glycine max]|nr:NAD kinase 2, chloroplastic [Glycine max]